MSEMRSTCLTISEAALYNNARRIRRRIPANVGMMCVVKADAYGHGAAFAARAQLRAGADGFAVAMVEEAARLRAAGIEAPLLILGGGDAASLREAVHAGAAQAVYSPEMLDVLQDEARRAGVRAQAHLKIDTGMSRIGVCGDAALDRLLAHWRDHCPQVEMAGIFTHFCAADSDPDFTRAQNARFAQALARARRAGFSPLAHAAATSAMLTGAYQYDCVRAGIALYGTLSDIEGLEYAQTLSARPVRIERIHAGDTVGYGRVYTADGDRTIMTVPVGYGDGYPRILGGRAQLLVGGRRAPIVGRVCMDMLMADVSAIPGVTLESEVVLMGAQGGERIAPDELAALAETIPYEIMLGFSPRLGVRYEAMDAR